MSETDSDTDIKRWTARRKAALVLDIIKGKTTVAQAARAHGLTVGEVEQWLEDFTTQGTEALRAHPRDAEARHLAERKQLLAKIGELTMDMEILKIAAQVQGKQVPDVNS